MPSEAHFLHDYRCACGKLLFKGALLTCALQIKCKRCGSMTSLRGIKGGISAPGSYALFIDRNARILSVNPSACSLMGYAEDEFLAMRLCEIDAELREGIYARLWNMIRSQPATFSIDTVQRKKDGSMVDVNMSFKFSELNKEECAFVIVTGLFAEEEAVCPPQGECAFVSSISPRGVYTYLSSNAAKSLGYLASEMLGKPMFEFFSPNDAGKEAEIRSYMQAGRPFRVLKKDMLHKNGTTVAFDAYFAPLRSEDGAFAGYEVLEWLSTPLRSGGVLE